MTESAADPAAGDGGEFPVLPHSGIIAIVGRTNVGKSSLLNRILGEKVSIVSPIVQTTRHVIRGILTTEMGQMVFLDTPGLHSPQSMLGSLMNKAAQTSTKGADIILLLLDRSEPPQPGDELWMKRLVSHGGPATLVLNKADLDADFSADYRNLLQLHAGANAAAATWPWFSLSADTGLGLPGLMTHLWQTLPAGHQLFPAEVLTDFPRKIAIGDLIREKLILDLYGELPHSVAVWVETIEEGAEGDWQISARIYVDRPGQKPIIIGRKGNHIKMVKELAERQLEKIYERRVTVDFDIKVEKDWQKNFWILRQLGHGEP